VSAPNPTEPRLFGRTPRGIYGIVALITVAAVLATFASVVPWYVYTATLNQTWGYDSSSQFFTPGPGGYVHSCSTYFTSRVTLCVSFSYNYGPGPGTQLISELYAAILGLVVTTAALGCGAGLTIEEGLRGRVRARRMRTMVLTFVVVAMCSAAVSSGLLVASQAPAFGQFAGGCPGFSSAATPCTTFLGVSHCVEPSGSQCLENNVTWQPGIGWYLAIASAGVLAFTLVALRMQPLGQSCPFCGILNRFNARYCDTCSHALPAVAEKHSPGYRL